MTVCINSVCSNRDKISWPLGKGGCRGEETISGGSTVFVLPFLMIIINQNVPYFQAIDAG